MAIQNFEVQVIRTDTYLISIDTDIVNEEWMQGYSRVFYDVETPEDVAKDVAGKIMRLGSNEGFYEGYGYLKILNKDGRKKFISDGLNEVPDDKLCEGIVVKPITENGEFEFEVIEK